MVLGSLGVLADQADLAGLCQHVMSGEAELHPGRVVHDVVDGKVGESAGFDVADDVLGLGSASLE